MSLAQYGFCSGCCCLKEAGRYVAVADWRFWKVSAGKGGYRQDSRDLGISWAMKIVLSSVLSTGDRSKVPSYLLETREDGWGEKARRENG